MQPLTFARVKYAYTHPPEHGGWQGRGALMNFCKAFNAARKSGSTSRHICKCVCLFHTCFCRVSRTELAGEYGVITFGFFWQATDPHWRKSSLATSSRLDAVLPVNGIPDEQWLHVVPVTNHASTVSRAGICPTNRVLLLSLRRALGMSKPSPPVESVRSTLSVTTTTRTAAAAAAAGGGGGADARHDRGGYDAAVTTILPRTRISVAAAGEAGRESTRRSAAASGHTTAAACGHQRVRPVFGANSGTSPRPRRHRTRDTRDGEVVGWAAVSAGAAMPAHSRISHNATHDKPRSAQ